MLTRHCINISNTPITIHLDAISPMHSPCPNNGLLVWVGEASGMMGMGLRPQTVGHIQIWIINQPPADILDFHLSSSHAHSSNHSFNHHHQMFTQISIPNPPGQCSKGRGIGISPCKHTLWNMLNSLHRGPMWESIDALIISRNGLRYRPPCGLKSEFLLRGASGTLRSIK